MRDLFESFMANANKAIALRLVSSEQELRLTDGDRNNDSDAVPEFNPEFCHQLFGDNETIFGYKDLKVKLYYSSAQLNCYLDISYTEKVKSDETDGIEADNVHKIISDKFEINFCQSKDEFNCLLSKESQFKPYGQLIDKFTIDSAIARELVNSEYEIYLADMSTPGFEAYHQRMQTFLWWFIDAASYIDADDERWQYFVIYQVRPIHSNLTNGHSVKNERTYCFVGYATVYRYYAYPERIRPRISQFLVLPPFQRKGVGARLLQAIYNHYVSDDKVFDITVEDPSDNFTRIRDYVDANRCLQLESFSADNLKRGFSKEMAEDARNRFKISHKQSRRVYEILRFRATNRSDAKEYRDFRLEVKQRLNAPIKKMMLDLSRIEQMRKVPDQELALMKQTSVPALEVRLEKLDKEYRQLEEDYQRIVERLAIS